MRACGAPARLGDEDSKLYAACADMRSAGARLLARAQEASTVRVDVSITDLISVAIGVAWAAEQTITTRQEQREVVTRLPPRTPCSDLQHSPRQSKTIPIAEMRRQWRQRRQQTTPNSCCPIPQFDE